ncbi:MAG TPA: class I mannose-6-phosphate isomerase [Bacteroidales bacterium]|jgi:mannose-6-phosphate isomerase|nr:MAG: putative mannose-6-phosphate isomerase YvyI [Bacteroidetes bacterium ADurb.Bin012]HNQ59588.1 class I mannose-6-phosphate isomerase [Bacteroidales bacterium]HNU21168.1 class I mannose-6-phosphate isomerase [Bacteroidales bacterium]HNV16724.1 class I mannose-6-phosphate isomerase [Bacteroidales bacterium]HNZ79438.1 class I mannose-6-phosphate isomerase [Bacteroidales bacterium]
MPTLYPLKFRPIYKDKIWGGQRLKTLLNHDFSPLPNCGEAWLISGIEENNSIVSNGFLADNELNELVEVYMDELMGESVFERYGNEFPLLLKLLDANDWLSIQVHPNDEIAKARGLSGGKTEMWYIIHAEAGSELIAGFKKKISRFELQQLIHQKRISEVLNYETVKAGDVFYMPAGRIHSLGPGIVLAEIQQSSDTTYRIYDWDRVDDNGQSRQLHLDEAIDAIDFNLYTDYKTKYTIIPNRTTHLVQSPYFTTNLLYLNHPIEKDYGYIDSFVILLAVEGEVGISDETGNYSLRTGEAMLLPAITEKVIFTTATPSASILETFIDLD